MQRILSAGVLLFAVLAAAATWRWAFPAHDTIQQLQGLPVRSAVRLLGTVTCIDGPEGRFWLQDETGAVAVPLAAAGARLHVGETVAVRAVKTGDAGPGISVTGVRSAFARVRLPPPIAISLNRYPLAMKNGVRVQFTAVVRGAGVDGLGRAVLSIAGSGRTFQAIVAHPGALSSRLVNAGVRITAVPEQLQDAQGHIVRQQFRVPSGSDLRVVEPAPADVLIPSVRALYTNPSVPSGHRVRLQGRVAESGGTTLLLEDSWGAVQCDLTAPAAFSPGSMVQVEGFPASESHRIDLVAAQVRPLPPSAPQSQPESPSSSLITVAAVRALPPARAAQALPVRLHGVVTYDDPVWQQLFIEDGSGGIYVKYPGHPHVPAGTRITLRGVTDPGDFAPIVVAPRFQPEGAAPVPVPLPVRPATAAAGLLDSRYVVLSGIVHPLKFDEDFNHPVFTFELHTELGQVHVFTSPGFPDLRRSGRLEDAEVRIRGVFGTVFNARRQMIGYQLLVASPSDIRIVEPAVPDPFSLETTPIGSLLRFSPRARFGHRVRVAGTVTMIGPDYLYLQDASGGVQVFGDPGALRLGEQAEAAGFPTLAGRYSPVLSDAVFRTSYRPGRVVPEITTVESILRGNSDSRLVTVEGRLLATLVDPSGATLVLQCGFRTFTAQLSAASLGANLHGLRPGSLLRLTGVTAAQVDSSRLYDFLEQAPVGFHILLRLPGDIVVLRPAPFWTPRRAAAVFGLLAVVILAALAWVDALRRRIRRQNIALVRASETTQAIHDLSAAMQSVTTQQHFDTLVSVRGTGEIAQLVVGFNTMLAELRDRDHARRQAEARLHHMAVMDELTGLPNRRLLTDRLAHSLALARREGRMVALLYIDLDGFKIVNDSLGHGAGDRLLCEVAGRLRSRVRQSDTLARIGGDEFTLVLSHIHSESDAEQAAQDLLELLEPGFAIEGHSVRIGASIGISLFPAHGIEPGQLLQQADCAMYAAKRNGRNRIVQFGDELGNAARLRLTLENELRRAIADGAITLHYQPECDLVTGSILRFEALARWTHPTLGAISPQSFIPVAEESGLIVSLGAQLLERACRDALEWQRIAGHPVQVAVNVSSVQFARDSFIDEVAGILRRTRLDPRLLQIELTESATLTGVERAAALMGRLRSMGIGIAMDDFGTGYSSLSYLPRLPFDALKIDRSFVSELILRPETRAFVQSILTMAHNLRMRVIVEGIESQEQLDLVRQLGADQAQGFFLGRPTPDPIALLRRGPAAASSGARSAQEPVANHPIEDQWLPAL